MDMLQDKRVLEIGPGGNAGVALKFLLAGAKQVVCLDKFYSKMELLLIPRNCSTFMEPRWRKPESYSSRSLFTSLFRNYPGGHFTFQIYA
jgi:hypothetical protein